MITTTLNRIRAHGPCVPRWRLLLDFLGKTQADDEPLAYCKIAEVLGLDDALWCLRAEPQYEKVWRLYAVWCARQVQHCMRDPRSLETLNTAERYAHGEATETELKAAREAAEAAWETAQTAEAVARDAAESAWHAARVTACQAAWGAAQASANAAEWTVAWTVAREVAREVARAAQLAHFLQVVSEENSG